MAVLTLSAAVGCEFNQASESMMTVTDASTDGGLADTGVPMAEDVCLAAISVQCAVFTDAYLKAAVPGEMDSFGQAVALSGDLAVIGAPNEDGNGVAENDDSLASSGAVYVFQRSAGEWSQVQYVKASNVEANDLFGSAVALDGDTFAVGASLEDSASQTINGDQDNNNATFAGAVFVYTSTGGAFHQQAYLKASNSAPNSRFGEAVALEGDLLAVAAPFEATATTGIDNFSEDRTAFGSGAVYVFRRDGTQWLQEAFIKASNADRGDGFGESLALAGDVLIVGAPDESSASTGGNGPEDNDDLIRSGAVYVF
ncbi:MAG: hypothetical protein AAFV29_19705, partial [Myxococcota bacterium]